MLRDYTRLQTAHLLFFCLQIPSPFVFRIIVVVMFYVSRCIEVNTLLHHWNHDCTWEKLILNIRKREKIGSQPWYKLNLASCCSISSPSNSIVNLIYNYSPQRSSFVFSCFQELLINFFTYLLLTFSYVLWLLKLWATGRKEICLS